MKAPDKIYVPQNFIEAGKIEELDELVVEGSIEYIRKDALVQYLKEVIESEEPLAKIDRYEKGKLRAYRDILNDIENELI